MNSLLQGTVQSITPTNASLEHLPNKVPVFQSLSQSLLLEEPKLRHPFENGTSGVQRDCETPQAPCNKSLAVIKI